MRAAILCGLLLLGCSPSSTGSDGGTDAATAVDAGGADTLAPRDASSAATDAAPLDLTVVADLAATADLASSPDLTVAGPPVYCGHQSDCASGRFCAVDGTCKAAPCDGNAPCAYGYVCTNGACVSPTTGACDGSCASGQLCLVGSDGKGGVCTAPADQCFDEVQCGVNERCAAGRCTLACSSSADCRDGFACDTARGLCTTPTRPCLLTSDCQSPTRVCVAGACVPRSNGGACANAGDVWFGNGCVPPSAPSFECTVDGQAGSGAGTPGVRCAAGSICLHRTCFLSCDAPNQSACAAQTTMNVCKPLSSGGSTFNVCATAGNLGGQCGPGVAGSPTCGAGRVCVDGFCR